MARKRQADGPKAGPAEPSDSIPTARDATAPADWEARLTELEQRLDAGRSLGGAERVARQHAAGRLDARQRVAALLDPDSFRELGTLAGGAPRGQARAVAADALVAGFGSIQGRPVLVGAEDFSSRGGSIGLATHAKRLRLAQLAEQERRPLLMLLEGAGERVSNALERHAYAPNDLQALAALSGRVPTICLVLGVSAGHGALTAPLMDYVVMLEGAALFSAGPPLVEAATGERVDREELGGAQLHSRESGVAHDVASSEQAAFDRARRYLSYFPASAWERPPRWQEAQDEGERRLDEILDIVPANDRKAYDMRRVITLLADADSSLELQAAYGGALITSLARIGGESVAILANQPAVGSGAIDRAAADKGARFLDLADAFHLPVVFLADNPGVQAGPRAERSGALRAAARLFAAQNRLQVVKLHVTLRKAFGFGSSVMAMNPFDGQSLSLAFPGATLGAMPAAAGGRAADAEAELQARLSRAEASGPWAAADALAYDEVIDPRELRNTLLAGLRLSAGRRAAPCAPRRSGGIRP